MNIDLTLTLGTVVTKVCPPRKVLFITEYGLSPLDLFLVILRFFLMDSIESLCPLSALSIAASMPLPSTPKYALSL
jgi:hypothetical protein